MYIIDTHINISHIFVCINVHNIYLYKYIIYLYITHTYTCIYTYTYWNKYNLTIWS